MTTLITKIDTLLRNHDHRVDWTEYFMILALMISKRSPCNRLHVGCVIVNDQNNIISVGYNGFLAGAPHKSVIIDGHEVATVHAEQNAISSAAKYGISVKDCFIYITHFPCIHCSKILAASGIKKIYYYNDYKNNNLVYDLLNQVDVKIIKVTIFNT